MAILLWTATTITGSLRTRTMLLLYENNINVGIATATFTGIGSYTGSFTKNFQYRAN